MSFEKAVNYFFSFIMFVVIIIILGALYPQYFGVASQIITENFGNLVLLAFVFFFIYLLFGKERR